MTRRTYAGLRRRSARWLRQKRSVILDATFGRPSERLAVRQLARRLQARLVFVECRADEALIRARLAAREAGNGSASDARLALWLALKAAYVPATELEHPLIADMSRPLDTVVGELRKRIRPVESAVRAA